MTMKQLFVLFTLALLPLGGLPADKPPLSRELEKSLLEDIPSSLPSSRDRSKGTESTLSLPGPTITASELAGEDVGQQGESDPLLPIELQMRQLHRRLVDGDTGRETQLLQVRLVEQLEGLLESARARQQERTGLQSSNVGTGSTVAGTGASGTGEETTAESQVLEPPPEHLSPAIQRIWGSLPPAVRSELRGARIERFLPKYESMLEQFYRRLAAPR